MSSPFLSRQDIESWVPDAAASQGSVGFVAKLATSIGRAIASLREVLFEIQDEACPVCQNELERFLLWCQGVGVADGRLDDVLSRSKELHRQVLALLLRLVGSVLQAMLQLPHQLSQVELDDCDHLKALSEEVETMLRESDSDQLERPDTPSGSDSSDYGLVETMEEVSAYVDCLLDLAPALDNPALDIQTGDSEEPLPGANESFTASCEAALIYCRKIRDRFDTLPKYLVERLAEANAIRAVKIREMQRQTIEEETPANDDISESLFSRKRPQITETEKSSVPSTSVFSSAMATSSRRSAQLASLSKRIGSADIDDNISDATFASFSTAASSIGKGRPRVPPMPDVKEGSIDCTVCLLRLDNITTRKQWKRHVFRDLKPYVCTVEDCQASRTLFNHSGMWAEHESSHSATTSRSSVCVFCSATYHGLSPAYYKHVSAHLREVSLSVLPQTTDEDEEPGTNDSGSFLQCRSQGESDRALADQSTTGEVDALPYTIWPSMRRDPSDDKDSHVYRRSVALQRKSSADSLSDRIDNIKRVDRIIEQLLEARNLECGSQIDLHRSDIKFLCREGRKTFTSQPILLELLAPTTVASDIHGQFYDLLKVFERTGFPPESNYLFLGNYVDYGRHSIEVMCLLLAYKIKYPENFFLLRGNHEAAFLTRVYGFYSECKQRYDLNLWKAFVDMFNHMPLAATVGEKVFCVHGGLSPDLNTLEDIRRIIRPKDIPNTGLLCDLLWSDYDANTVGWSESDRGVAFTFGLDVVQRFLVKEGMSLIVRGHRVVEKGYQHSSDRLVATLWTAPNWQGHGNAGGILTIDESLSCTFNTIEGTS